MTNNELSCVENFVIKNMHGSISFLVPMDLVGIDLERDVLITEQGAEIYPEQFGQTRQKPPKGFMLNQPAVIALYNIKPKVR